MRGANPSLLALLTSCKFIYEELLVHLFFDKVVRHDCSPAAVKALKGLNPFVKTLIRYIQCTVKLGLLDLVPVWRLLKDEFTRLDTMWLFFDRNHERQALGTLLDLAVFVSESDHTQTKWVEISLRCRPDGLESSLDRLNSEARLQEQLEAATNRHAMYSLCLPSSIERLYVDLGEPPSPFWPNALSSLTFTGGHSFVKAVYPEDRGRWTFTLQPKQVDVTTTGLEMHYGFDVEA